MEDNDSIKDTLWKKYMNILLNVDSYKMSHFLQYPPGTEFVSSYIEARPKEGMEREVMFFGLQMFIQNYLTRPFTAADVEEAQSLCKKHGVPFNREGWDYILDAHGGFLPLIIEALPEGLVVPAGTPMVQVRNTDPKVPWLTSYMETALLRAVWYPSTVATISRDIKKVIKHWLDATSDDPEGQLPFKLHDFGARGCTSMEQAGIGGAAHLVNFMGTDTLTGVVYARQFYGSDIAGFSIPAAEHSTMTSWGREREADAYENMLTSFPTGLVAVVSDSYDIYKAVDTIWGEKLHDKVLAREGTLVVRPDSGDPLDMVLFCLKALGEAFGTETNSKGFKVLNPKVRVIQGDGIGPKDIENILMAMAKEGWSADNVAFGMGAGLLQHVNRDTFRFAMKASAAFVDNKWMPVFKDPVTDKGKASKKGYQLVYSMDRGTVVDSSPFPINDPANQLKKVYMKDTTDVPFLWFNHFEEVRKRAAV